MSVGGSILDRLTRAFMVRKTGTKIISLTDIDRFPALAVLVSKYIQPGNFTFLWEEGCL
jgi:hypothetical protein